MATQQPKARSFLALAYEPPRKVDPRRMSFDAPGPWFDGTVILLAIVLGIGLLF